MYAHEEQDEGGQEGCDGEGDVDAADQPRQRHLARCRAPKLSGLISGGTPKVSVYMLGLVKL